MGQVVRAFHVMGVRVDQCEKGMEVGTVFL